MGWIKSPALDLLLGWRAHLTATVCSQTKDPWCCLVTAISWLVIEYLSDCLQDNHAVFIWYNYKEKWETYHGLVHCSSTTLVWWWFRWKIVESFCLTIGTSLLDITNGAIVQTFYNTQFFGSAVTLEGWKLMITHTATMSSLWLGSDREHF